MPISGSAELPVERYLPHRDGPIDCADPTSGCVVIAFQLSLVGALVGAIQ